MKTIATLVGCICLVTAVASRAHADTPLAAQMVASGLVRPTFVTAAPGDDTRLFILEQWSGNVLILDLATLTLLARPFVTQTGLSITDEQGLLGMAFHPNYPATPFVYLSYTRGNGASRITRYTLSSDPDSLNPASAINILTVAQPQANQNGGWIAFGPDGYLYVALGDGGGLNDDDLGHDPLVGNGQSLATRLGKILRIDVDGGSPYAIPPTNPFIAMGSPANEIWAYGLRNPWRPAFDRMTGDLYIADVGQGSREEVDFEVGTFAGGANYGWREFQGSAVFNCPNPCDSSGHVPPVFEYTHTDTLEPCAIIGGYVYRGSAIPDLAGHYFFADLCAGWIKTLRIVGGAATDLRDRTADLAPGGGLDIVGFSSFGEDADGELYVCDQFDGEVWKIVADLTSVDIGVAPFSLGAIAPNPMAGSARFAMRLGAESIATVSVHDASGRRVRAITSGLFGAGSHALTWDGADDSAARVAPGVYFLRLEAAGSKDSRKVIVVR